LVILLIEPSKTKRMSDKTLQYLILGVAVYLIAKGIHKQLSDKPLAEEIIQGTPTTDKIDRALSRLTSGDVKVNDTPEETKNAVG
jgi:hypothetical protein